MIVASAAWADEAVERSYRVDVVLAADGSLQQVTPAESVPGTVASFLVDRISHWRFAPGTVDGEPAPTETSVMVRLGARPDPSNPEVALVEVIEATVGAVSETTVAPRYPRMALAASRGGTVVMVVDIDGDGRVLDARLHEHSPTTNRALTRAALESVREWTFKPERVAGQGVPATLVVPVCFTMQRIEPGRTPELPTSGNCEFSLTGDDEGEKHTFSLTLEPAATLLSDPTAAPPGA